MRQHLRLNLWSMLQRLTFNPCSKHLLLSRCFNVQSQTNLASHWRKWLTNATSTVATHSNTTNGIWGIVSRLHGDTSGASWPEVLHCYEATHQSAMLRRFTKQHWRTVWYEAGVAELNCGCQKVASISLSIETPPNDNPVTTVTSPKDLKAAKGQGTLSKRL
ncbi:hypothetical protein F503_08812 [Ophiostoma piceae UAMH 11346]|uniref:Uncharacterized protein n=1 Tax=Ophiostoma piceae (strain UAMH 11346) TaxID=1262450 RepID=S3CQM3_OPHP1|nr:hypothetical protein F503_08812 [Ophiostoma piceae UAMH 11346]